MLILFFSGIILFCVSVAALAAPDSLKQDVFGAAWKQLSLYNKEVIQVQPCSPGDLSLVLRSHPPLFHEENSRVNQFEFHD